MKRGLALVVVVLVLFGTLAADPALASGRRGHGHHHHHHHGWWWPGALIGGLAIGAVAAATYPVWAAPRTTYVTPVYVPAAPVVTYPVWAAPRATYVTPVYVPAAPVVTYAPPPVYQQPPAPLVQREVVYPHGRYVLYGDGVTQPWQWVWIAAAPPPPPPPAPPTQ